MFVCCRDRVVAVDIQGFNVGSTFIPKVITAVDPEKKLVTELVLKPPFPEKLLGERDQHNVIWCWSHLHHIPWDMGSTVFNEGGLKLSQEMGERFRVIVTKGHQKARWLRASLPADTYKVINIEPDGPKMYKNSRMATLINARAIQGFLDQYRQ